MTEKLTTIEEILGSIQRSLKVPKDKENKFGNFAYRNAEGILQAFKEEVQKDIYPHDIAIITDFDIVLIGNRTFLKCTAILVSGWRDRTDNTTSLRAQAFAELDISKKGMDQAQLTGAATSYAKKYALCNLLAIDDSKSDPDADEKNGEKKQAPKNKFGLSPNGSLAKGDDMNETLKQNNEVTFANLKAEIESCTILSQVDSVFLTNKKEFAQLKKYANALYEMLIESGKTIKQQLEPKPHIKQQLEPKPQDVGDGLPF